MLINLLLKGGEDERCIRYLARRTSDASIKELCKIILLKGYITENEYPKLKKEALRVFVRKPFEISKPFIKSEDVYTY